MPDDRPDPPPHWWLKRGLLAAAGLIVALLALRLLAGWNADRRLAAHTAAERAAGRLVDPEDLDDPPLRDGENAAHFYRRAAAAITLTPAEEAAVTRYAYVGPTAANLPARRSAVAANRQPLADLRTARELPGVDWGVKYRRPVWKVSLSQLQDQRPMAELLRAAAEVAIANGNSAEAVERLFDLVRLSDAQWGPTIVAQLVGIGIIRLTADEIQLLLPSLDFQGLNRASTAGAATRPVARRRVLDLIHVLLDDRPRQRAAARAVQGDRVMIDDLLHTLADESWLLRPAFNAAAASPAPWDAPLDRAARNPTAATIPPLVAAVRPMTEPFEFRNLYATSPNWVESDARALTDRRLAAVALAAKLYQADHAGQPPPTLDALVPAYLPAVPADPFDPAGGLIRYAPAFRPGPTAAPSPRLYSVGEDGLDAGGAGNPANRWTASGDAPFELAPPPATRPLRPGN